MHSLIIADEVTSTNFMAWEVVVRETNNVYCYDHSLYGVYMSGQCHYSPNKEFDLEFCIPTTTHPIFGAR